MGVIYLLSVDFCSAHDARPVRFFTAEHDAQAWIAENPPGPYEDFILETVSADGHLVDRPGSNDDREIVGGKTVAWYEGERIRIVS